MGNQKGEMATGVMVVIMVVMMLLGGLHLMHGGHRHDHDKPEHKHEHQHDHQKEKTHNMHNDEGGHSDAHEEGE